MKIKKASNGNRVGYVGNEDRLVYMQCLTTSSHGFIAAPSLSSRNNGSEILLGYKPRHSLGLILVSEIDMEDFFAVKTYLSTRGEVHKILEELREVGRTTESRLACPFQETFSRVGQHDIFCEMTQV